MTSGIISDVLNPDQTETTAGLKFDCENCPLRPKVPRDVKERAALEVFIARELYSLSLADWQHLTGTFTFGSGDSKAELNEIIRQSLALWEKV